MRRYLLSTILITVAFVLTVALLSSGSAETPDIEIPDEDAKLFVQLTGFSMYPTLKEGDKLPCEKKDMYNIGDIVTFGKGNNFVSHRIIGEINGKYVTKGDNNLFPDLVLVDSDNVVCKLIL